jgi:undecaprenyl-diphosphatase
VIGASLWHLRHRERRAAWTWLVLGLSTWLLPELVKNLSRRPRPRLWPRLVDVSGFSFPSGHAVAGMALYPVLGFVLLRGRGHGKLGRVLGALVGVYIGAGRLYLGVHWPSDVLAGWLLGALLSAAALRAIRSATPAPARRPG